MNKKGKIGVGIFFFMITMAILMGLSTTIWVIGSVITGGLWHLPTIIIGLIFGSMLGISMGTGAIMHYIT